MAKLSRATSEVTTASPAWPPPRAWITSQLAAALTTIDKHEITAGVRASPSA